MGKKKEKRFKEMEAKYGRTEEEILAIADNFEKYINAYEDLIIPSAELRPKRKKALKTAKKLLKHLRNGEYEKVMKKKYLNAEEELQRGRD